MQKFYAKIGEISCKNSRKRKKNNGIHATFLRSLNLDNSLLKTKFKKIFLIPYSTRDELSISKFSLFP